MVGRWSDRVRERDRPPHEVREKRRTLERETAIKKARGGLGVAPSHERHRSIMQCTDAGTGSRLPHSCFLAGQTRPEGSSGASSLPVLFPSTTARSAANPPLHAFPRGKREILDILPCCYTATATAHPPVQVRSDSISFLIISAITNAGVVAAVARDRELRLCSGGSVVADDDRRRRRLPPSAAGAEGRLGRAPRQVRRHQRLRLRLRPQRALVAARTAAPRGHAARAVPGGRTPGPTATTAVAPEAEEGAYGVPPNLSLGVPCVALQQGSRAFVHHSATPGLVLAGALRLLAMVVTWQCCLRTKHLIWIMLQSSAAAESWIFHSSAMYIQRRVNTVLYSVYLSMKDEKLRTVCNMMYMYACSDARSKCKTTWLYNVVTIYVVHCFFICKLDTRIIVSWFLEASPIWMNPVITLVSLESTFWSTWY